MGLHIIIGEDDFLVSETAKKIIGDGIGLEIIDSMNSTNAELQLKDIREADASYATPPFLDPRKVTWWKNVHFLPSSGKKSSSEDVKSALEKLATKFAASKLEENQSFIISGPKLLKTSVFAKTLSSVAEMVVFAEEKPYEAARNAVVRVIDMAKEMGLRFGPGVAEKFVSIVGVDSRSLMSEMNKLRDYLGGEAEVIAAVDVEQITSMGVGVEPAVWDVTDAIGKRDLNAALSAIRKFELENGFAVLMSGVIEKFFRQLIAVKQGKVGNMNPYAIKKNEGFASKWSLQELRIARARFLMLREKVVSGTTSGDVLVINEVVRACRGKK